MKKLSLLFLVLLTPLWPAVSEDFKIPVLIGQTGASSTFGKVELDGYTLAVEDWNKRYGGIEGKKVSLAVDDTQTDQAATLSSIHRFASLGYKVILGPTWLDGVAKGAIPVAKAKKVLLVTPSAESEALPASENGPITFYYHSRSEVAELLKFAASNNLKRLTLVYEQEPFAELLKKLLVEMNQGSVEFINQIGVQAGEADFKSIVPRIVKGSPDAFLVFVWDERSLLTLLQTLNLSAKKTPILTVHDGEGWLVKPEFKQHINHIFYSKFVLKSSEFMARFKERFGYDVLLTGSNAYDALWSVLLALKSGAKDAESIRGYLVSTELETVTFGKAKLTKSGAFSTSEVAMVEYKSPSGE